jgi:hypothetical protein
MALLRGDVAERLPELVAEVERRRGEVKRPP